MRSLHVVDRGWLVVFLFFLVEWWRNDGGVKKEQLPVPSRDVFHFGRPLFHTPSHLWESTLWFRFGASRSFPKHNSCGFEVRHSPALF